MPWYVKSIWTKKNLNIKCLIYLAIKSMVHTSNNMACIIFVIPKTCSMRGKAHPLVWQSTPACYAKHTPVFGKAHTLVEQNVSMCGQSTPPCRTKHTPVSDKAHPRVGQSTFPCRTKRTPVADKAHPRWKSQLEWLYTLIRLLHFHDYLWNNALTYAN